jgi:hypothetical protein
MTTPITLRILAFFCLYFYVMPGFAQDAPDDLSDEQQSSGEVTIKGDENEVISEFRINGLLYMIRITPKKGKPYYLVDADGDGNLETRWNDLTPDLLIPSWVLLRW